MNTKKFSAVHSALDNLTAFVVKVVKLSKALYAAEKLSGRKQKFFPECSVLQKIFCKFQNCFTELLFFTSASENTLHNTYMALQKNTGTSEKAIILTTFSTN